MDIRKQLPYLGTKTDSGFVVCEDYRIQKTIQRPDYQRLKKSVYNTEADCVSILTGVANPNHLYRYYDAVMNLKVKRAWLSDGSYKAFQECIESGLDPDDVLSGMEIETSIEFDTSDTWWTCQRMVESRQIVDLFQDLAETIDDGVNGKEFKIIDKEVTRDAHSYFSETMKFETKPFLQWMEQNGYLPPREVMNSDDTTLTGKERQELGRLRAEKQAMDSTNKAAIEVGALVEKAKSEGRKLLKKEVEDCAYKVDSTIAYTRIMDIWKKLPEDIRHGSGRPRSTKD